MPLNRDQKGQLYTVFQTQLAEMIEIAEEGSNAIDLVRLALQRLAGGRLTLQESKQTRSLVDADRLDIFGQPQNIPALTDVDPEEAKEYLRALCRECLKPDVDLRNPGNLMERADQPLGFGEVDKRVGGAASTASAAAMPSAPPAEEDDLYVPTKASAPAPSAPPGVPGEYPMPSAAGAGISKPRASAVPLPRAEDRKLPIVVSIRKETDLATHVKRERGSQFFCDAIYMGDNSDSHATELVFGTGGTLFNRTFISTVGLCYKSFDAFLEGGPRVQYRLTDVNLTKFPSDDTAYYNFIKRAHLIFMMANPTAGIDSYESMVAKCSSLGRKDDLFTMHYDERGGVHLEPFTPENLRLAFEGGVYCSKK